MDKQRIELIKRYEEEIRKLEDCEENKRRLSLWADDPKDSDYIWHPCPRYKNPIPFSVELERIGMAQILNFSLVKFYTDPEEYILRFLEASLYKFKTFNDCTPIAKSVTFWPGVGFEASLFGMKQILTEEDAWVGREQSIKERVPLDSIQIPDFHNHPVMKETKVFYEKMREILSDDFGLVFPQWCRSPWGVAWHIRGISNLILDYMDAPNWVKGFVDLITDARIAWSKQRSEAYGIPLVPTNFFNDEVLSPIVSPKLYEEIILPSESRISDFFGGINYWHSCGDTTPLIELIDKVPNVHMVHVSPWTDIWKASEKYSAEKTLEFVLHPTEDVMYPSNNEILRQKLIDIKEAAKGRYLTVRADGFVIMTNVKSDIERLQHWINEANDILL